MKNHIEPIKKYSGFEVNISLAEAFEALLHSRHASMCRFRRGIQFPSVVVDLVLSVRGVAYQYVDFEVFEA